MFSLILPTWNRAARIDDAVGSVLAQTLRDFELIIADDGSTDGTVAHLQKRYAAEIAAGRIRLLTGEHAGVSAARNRALAAAQGEWIAYVDSDNTIRPEFLAQFSDAISRRPEANCFHAKFLMQAKGVERGQAYDRAALIARNFIDLGVFVHRRSLYKQLGGFDESMRRLVDWELILRYTKDNPPVFIDAVVMDYDDAVRADRITAGRESFLAWRQVVWNRYASELPLVSTVVTAYNHANYIREALDSALRQEGNFRHEILVSDDGSTDGTPAIVAEYADKFPQLIRDISSKENQGISANMRKCFAAAKGEYIAVLEGDDFWVSKQKLARQVRFLEEHVESPMVFCRTEIRDSKGGSRRYSKIQERLPELVFGRDMFNAGSASVIINFSSSLFRREALTNLPEILWKPRLSEVALAFHLERTGPLGYISEALSAYRQHEASTFTGAGFIGRRQQEIACREVAKCVCAPEYVALLDQEIQRIDEVIRLRQEAVGRTGLSATRRSCLDIIRRACQCYRENGLLYTLRRIFFGRQY